MTNGKIALILGGATVVVGSLALGLGLATARSCDDPDVVQGVVGLMQAEANMFEQVTGLTEIVEAELIGEEIIRCYGTIEYTILNQPQRGRIVYTVTETLDGEEYIEIKPAN